MSCHRSFQREVNHTNWARNGSDRAGTWLRYDGNRGEIWCGVRHLNPQDDTSTKTWGNVVLQGDSKTLKWRDSFLTCCCNLGHVSNIGGRAFVEVSDQLMMHIMGFNSVIHYQCFQLKQRSNLNSSTSHRDSYKFDYEQGAFFQLWTRENCELWVIRLAKDKHPM